MRWIFAILAFAAVCPTPSNAQPATPATTQSAAGATVVWISIDGFRGDYLKRINPPALTRLAHEGASTFRERPIFPSLTFPNHVAQVTGTTVDGHGIPTNDFFDTATQKSYSFPDDGSLIRAEPIWITAKRQGLRVAVIDWPMSHAQTGEFKSDFFEQHFDTKETDAQRLDHVADVLDSDHAAVPLRLVLTYISHVDSTGHKFGPDSPEIDKAVMDADATVDKFVQRVTQWFDKSHDAAHGAAHGAAHDADDELYILLTTDHGMQKIHTNVNLDRLLGVDLVAGIKSLTSGPVANIYLGDLPDDQKTDRADKIIARLKTNDFLHVWKSSDMPPELHYSDPTRVGDVVVLLKPGYHWVSQRNAATMPAPPGATHGYDPAECPNMYGFAIAWRYRHPLTAHDLGPIDNTQWHATVAHLLGIDPSAQSDKRFIYLR